jgi:hypothetical protein
MKPGIYPGLTLAEYLAIPAISNSGLRNMGRGPREYWHRQRFALEQTQAMLDGTLAGIQILDPQAYLDRVVEWKELVMEDAPRLKWEKVSPEYYVSDCGKYRLNKNGSRWDPRMASDTAGFEWVAIGAPSDVRTAKKACQERHDKANPPKPKIYADGSTKLAPKLGAKWDAFVAANPDRTVVVRADLEKAARVARAVRDNPEARDLLAQRWRTELTIVWEHESGALCKARPDWLTDPARRVVLIGDLKLVRSSAERAFNKASADREYHAQVAWYGEGLRAHYPMAKIEHVLLAVESSGSHDSTVFDLPDNHIKAGDKLNEERLQRILAYEDEYGDRPWPGRCHRTTMNYEEYASWAIPEELREADTDGLNWGDRRK